jgi:hypothetical protein
VVGGRAATRDPSFIVILRDEGVDGLHHVRKQLTPNGEEAVGFHGVAAERPERR